MFNSSLIKFFAQSFVLGIMIGEVMYVIVKAVGKIKNRNK